MRLDFFRLNASDLSYQRIFTSKPTKLNVMLNVLVITKVLLVRN